MMLDTEATTTKPQETSQQAETPSKSGNEAEGEIGASNPREYVEEEVKVREITADDASFFAERSVKTFQAKMEWNIPTEKLPFLIDLLKTSIEEDTKLFHKRFVIEKGTKRVGHMHLRCQGDKMYISNRASRQAVRNIGLWGSLRLWLMGLVLDTEVKESHVCLVDEVGVLPECRGQGLGKVLLDFAEDFARQQNKTSMVLYVAFDNPAKRLYERQGYTERGTKTRFCYRTSGVRGFYIMEKQLEDKPGKS